MTTKTRGKSRKNKSYRANVAATPVLPPPGCSEPLPRITIAPGTLEALKWLGLALMTLDHVNKYLVGQGWPWAFAAGRLSLPLFGIVFAYNLARPGAPQNGRAMKRLLIYGLLASPFYIGLGGILGWWPLNILFTLLVAACVVWLMEKGGFGYSVCALLSFLVGGALVEFWWPALFFILAAWCYFKTGIKPLLTVCALALASLTVINGNFWALASLPFLLAAPFIDCRLPRVRHLFYVYYPAHLAVIFFVSLLLRN
jgi:hypothetical protein